MAKKRDTSIIVGRSLCMSTTCFVRFVVLAAIYGATFLHLRTGALILHPSVLSIFGVWRLVGLETIILQSSVSSAVVCPLIAAVSYEVVATYTNFTMQVDPVSNAQCNVYLANGSILPAVPLFPTPIPTPTPTLTPTRSGITTVRCVLAPDSASNIISFMQYFWFMPGFRAIFALAVTLPIWIFGMMWGELVLVKSVLGSIGLGAATALAGTALVTEFSRFIVHRKPVETHG